MKSKKLFKNLRKDYHKQLCKRIIGYRKESEAYTLADGSSTTSVDLAARMVGKMDLPACSEPATGQTAGKLFTDYTMEFLQAAFDRLRHLRPGTWYFSASQAGSGIALFDQYQHLADLQNVISNNKELKAALGGDDSGLSRKDLEDAIGPRGRISEILNRKRPLTLPMVQRLSEQLGLPVEVLTQTYQLAQTFPFTHTAQQNNR